jgi:hypothetical protein
MGVTGFRRNLLAGVALDAVAILAALIAANVIGLIAIVAVAVQ